MALIVKDRVKETSSTAGTGTLTLAGTSSGFQSFSVIGNGNTTYYAIVDNTTGDWEVGVGTYTASGTTLSRDTILESSNGGSAVSFAANSKDVFVTYPAEKSFSLDQTLGVTNGGTGATALTGLVLGNGTSAFTTVTAPAGTVVGTTDTQTLTNKRITQRVSSTASTTSPWAWSSDSYDEQCFTALANALTINADSGTPTDGQRAIFRFKDDGTARALTWTTGSSKAFRAIGITLPTTTVINKTMYVGCIYNAADSRWDAVATVTEA